MSDLIPFARTVVWRHPCDCASASRPLEPGEEAEHRFDVDGEPFPWHITEAGATFRRRGELYLVSLTLVPLLRENNEACDVTFGIGRYPVLTPRVQAERARPFPWALIDPLTLTQDGGPDIPLLDLTFIAQHVDADVDIPEEDTQP